MPVIVNFLSISPAHVIRRNMERHLHFAEKLREIGHQYCWIVHTSSHDHVIREYIDKGLDVEIVPRSHTRGVRLVLYVIGLIRRKEIAVMHMHFIRSYQAVLLMIANRFLGLGVKFVYYKHCPGRIIESRLNIKRYVNPLSVLGCLADRVVCVADGIVDNCLNRNVRPEKIVRIFNGVDVAEFMNTVDRGKVRHELKIAPGWRIVSIIKEARPGFGFDELLRSIPVVLSVYPDTAFLVVGGGIDTERLKSLARDLKIQENVFFLGLRQDVPDILAESFMTVDPCPTEAFGLSIVESMAAGKPVIAVNAWGPKEIIVDGETGILIPRVDSEHFAKAMTRMLSDEGTVKRMGSLSIERVRRHFTMESNVGHVINLSMLLLDEKKGVAKPQLI